MNSIDDQLDRLFRGARPAGATPVPMPYGLETKVLAAWRSRSETGFWDMRLLTRGLTVAIMIMGLSLWPVLQQSNATTSDPFSDYLQGADASLTVDDTP